MATYPKNNQKEKDSISELRIKKSGFSKSIIKYYKKFPFLYTITILSTLISAATTVVMPLIIKNLVSNKDNLTHPNIVLNYTYIIIALQIISGIMMYFRNLCGSMIGVKVEIDYRTQLLNHLLKIDMSYYENNKIGESLTKLISDTQVIGDNMQAVPITLLSSIFTFLGGIAVLININWLMSLIVLGIVISILIISILNVQVIRILNYKWRKVYTEVNSDISDRISTITLIKSNATENKEEKRFKLEHIKYYNSARKTIRFDSFTRAVLITLLTGINTVGLATSLVFVSKGLISALVIIPFMLSVNTLIFPVVQSIQFLGNWAKTSTSILRVNEILNVEPKIKDVAKPVIIKEIKNDIIFDQVSFKYKEEAPLIIDDFTFTFSKGKSYAIVGATGVGKSTISKLLLRYYDPQKGKILVNNNNLKDIQLQSYLQNVGYIEQDPQILYGTIIDNIAYGQDNVTTEQVELAAKKANLHDFITELPAGYQTLLGEKGINLSGGQKQRIAIARIFLKNPDLLILDEATSALDNIVEKEIQTQFANLMVGRTSIVIAHRLSTIKNADQILVFEKNKGLVQVGKFDELKVKEGHFKNLYQAGLME